MANLEKKLPESVNIATDTLEVAHEDYVQTLDSKSEDAEAENWIETQNQIARKARKAVMDIQKWMVQANPQPADTVSLSSKQ